MFCKGGAVERGCSIVAPFIALQRDSLSFTNYGASSTSRINWVLQKPYGS
jgi:hypothetical protein